MRNELFEGLIIGATVGLAVVAIRVLLAGASAGQALALVLAGVALGGCQLALSRRRLRGSGQPPVVRPAMPRRLSRHNPFAQELTHNWTGLDDRLTEEGSESRSEERR